MYLCYIGGMSGSIGNGKENGNNYLGSRGDKSKEHVVPWLYPGTRFLNNSGFITPI